MSIIAVAKARRGGMVVLSRLGTKEPEVIDNRSLLKGQESATIRNDLSHNTRNHNKTI